MGIIKRKSNLVKNKNRDRDVQHVMKDKYPNTILIFISSYDDTESDEIRDTF